MVGRRGWISNASVDQQGEDLLVAVPHMSIASPNASQSTLVPKLSEAIAHHAVGAALETLSNNFDISLATYTRGA